MEDLSLADCYRLLELPPGAGPAEVREAYLVLSRVWHPDRFAGNCDLLARANARQQELNAAYQRLLVALRDGDMTANSGETEGVLAGVASDAAAGAVGPSGSVARKPETRLHRRVAWARSWRSVAGRRRLPIAVALLVGTTALLLNALQSVGGVVRTERGGVLTADALAVGGAHVCGSGPAGVSCWGRSDLGQAGRIRTRARSRAAPVASDLTTALAAGLAHTCALLTGGEVRCWGGNFAGQLGDASLQDRDSPGPVAGPADYAAISALGRHTCGVTRDGALRCWGDDTDGQLGIGSPAAACRLDDLRFSCSDRPEAVFHNRPWRSVTAGVSHTCALDTGGSAYCWGSNAHGQLGGDADEVCRGPGGGQQCRRRPGIVRGLPARVASIAAGAAHTCALDSQGRAWCWGSNQFGQVGDRDPADVPAPRLSAGNLRFRALVAGGFHTCGIARSGTLYCWGRDANKELRGLGRDRCGEVRCALEPVQVRSWQVQLAAAGFGRTCLTALDSTVHCWGRGESSLRAEPGAPVVLRSGVRRLWAQVVWWAGSAQRYLDRKVLIPLRELEH